MQIRKRETFGKFLGDLSLHLNTNPFATEMLLETTYDELCDQRQSLRSELLNADNRNTNFRTIFIVGVLALLTIRVLNNKSIGKWVKGLVINRGVEC